VERDKLPLPEKIEITEVGPRDGFQNVKGFIPTETKVRVIDAIAAAGVPEIEITSFVHPAAVPQMADASEVAEAVLQKHRGKVQLVALVPNKRGAENAAKCGLEKVTYVISASEAHNQSNVKRTAEESFVDLYRLRESLPHLSVKLSLATAFGCPFEGGVPLARVVELVENALACGVGEIVLCDTIGIANPVQVMEVVGAVRGVTKELPLGMHMHDTRGLGLANMLAGMMAGVSRFETSVGGLGGCPFAPGSAGNTASEDAINMVHEMGVRTGIDLVKYMEAVAIVKREIQANLSGRLSGISCK